MKKYLLISFCLFLLCACEPLNSEKLETLAQYYKLDIITIGNHQYISPINAHSYDICHYEDCEYCIKHRGY